jgi:transcriptional regulator with XRE-family HTH domain
MPSDLAQRIRDARAARALSVEEAERATKIRRRFLEAIEAGDFAQLPDGPPSRGFIKNYARFLGLDPEAALSDFEAEVGVPVIQLKDPAPPPPARVRAQSKLTQVALPDVRWRGALPGDDLADLDALAEADDEDVAAESRAVSLGQREGTTGRAVVLRPQKELRATGSSFRLKKLKGPFEEYDPNIQRRRGGSRTPLMPLASLNVSKYFPYVLGALVSVAVLAFLGFVVVPRVGEFLGTVQLPFAAQPGEATTPSSTEPQPQIGVTFTAPQAPQTNGLTPVAPVIAGTAAPAQSVPPLAGGGLQLALDARERAWVRVRVDGNIVFEGIPPIGPGEAYSAQQDISVETGNAGAFDILLNNTRIGPLGARNETVKKTYSAAQ